MKIMTDIVVLAKNRVFYQDSSFTVGRGHSLFSRTIVCYSVYSTFVLSNACSELLE